MFEKENKGLIIKENEPLDKTTMHETCPLHGVFDPEVFGIIRKFCTKRMGLIGQCLRKGNMFKY